jgi:hypothetical protein
MEIRYISLLRAAKLYGLDVSENRTEVFCTSSPYHIYVWVEELNSVHSYPKALGRSGKSKQQAVCCGVRNTWRERTRGFSEKSKKNVLGVAGNRVLGICYN